MNFNITPVVKILLIINAIVFAITNLLDITMGEGFVSTWFAVHYPESEYFQPIQLLTYMFIHGDIWHIGFNMLLLFMAGPPVEHIWGSKQFLAYYFFTGFGALALYFVVKYIQIYYTAMSPQEIYITANTPMVGASGAIYGILAAYGFLFPNNTVRLIFPPIDIKIKYFVFFLGLLELNSGITDAAGLTSSNIAHFAHVSGAIFGLLLIIYWNKGGTIGR